MVLVVAGALVVTASVRTSNGSTRATVEPSLRAITVPGHRPLVPWPKTGQSAVSIPGLGLAANSGPELPVPVASLAKVMAGYIVLNDHPLAVGESGPTITMTPTDIADYQTATAEDQTSLLVAPGEQLSELQLLEGMLIRSASDYTDALARWDAGSVPAFVAKMNTTARALGMRETRYADVTGYDPNTVSTAVDQLIIGARSMASPAFASIVDNTSATLPVAGTVSSYTPFVGNDSVIGVKSGFTDQSGGCDLLATLQPVGGYKVDGQLVGQRRILVLAVVTGQEMADTLPVTAFQALGVAMAAAGAVHDVRVLRPGQPVATVSDGAGSVSGHVGGGVSLMAWPSQRVGVRLRLRHHIKTKTRPGTVIGSAVVHLGSQRVVIRVRLAGRIPSKSLVERLW